MTLLANLLQYILPLLPAMAAPEPSGIELLFAGDAMMHDAQIEAARTSSGHDFSGYFSSIKPYIESADFSVVNLEAPLGGAPYRGYPCFSAPDEFAAALSDAGFDFLLLANNHILDCRDRGLRRTVATLDSLDIPHTGAFRNAAERDSLSPAIVSVDNFKLALLNYTYGTNGIRPQGDVVVNYIDEDKIRTDIAAARKRGAELVAVCIHWGDEYKMLPGRDQKRLADKLVALDADMIVGSHPHVVQPMEIRTGPTGKPVLLAYSLGNLVSNMKTVDTRGGAMVMVKIERDPSGVAHVASAAYSLIHVEPPSTTDGNFRVTPAHRCSHVNVNAFRRNAERIFSKYNVNVPVDSSFIKTL